MYSDLFLLDAAFTSSETFIVSTAIQAGLRQGEILGLKWEDIDWVHRQLYVRRQYTNYDFEEPKTKSSKRSVTLSRDYLRELSAGQKICPSHATSGGSRLSRGVAHRLCPACYNLPSHHEIAARDAGCLNAESIPKRNAITNSGSRESNRSLELRLVSCS